MELEQPKNPVAMEMLQGKLGSPLKPGELGVLLARAGVGKTACLTHIAMEHLLSGQTVLHVCVDEIPEKAKVWYHEFLKNIVAAYPDEQRAELQHRIEPLRFILSYLHNTFSPEKLEQSVRDLEERANFRPAMVVLDGLNFDHIARSAIESLHDFAERHCVSLWMSARTHRHITMTNERGIPYPCHEIDDLFGAIILLEPVRDAVQIRVLKNGSGYQPEHPLVFLNPQTYLLHRG